MILKISKNIQITLTEAILACTNIVTFNLLRTQNLQLEKQQEHILKLSSQLGELKESFVLLEEKSLLTKET